MDVGLSVVGALRCDSCWEHKTTTIDVGQVAMCRECRDAGVTLAIGNPVTKVDGQPASTTKDNGRCPHSCCFEYCLWDKTNNDGRAAPPAEKTNDLGPCAVCRKPARWERETNVDGQWVYTPLCTRHYNEAQHPTKDDGHAEVEKLRKENAILHGEVKLLQEAYAKVVGERNYWTHQTALRNQTLREIAAKVGLAVEEMK
jgi:hypothetical protein